MCNKPIMLPDNEIDVSELKGLCQEYIDILDNEDHVMKDGDHYIFEEAMTIFFGDDVWNWINEKLK